MSSRLILFIALTLFLAVSATPATAAVDGVVTERQQQHAAPISTMGAASVPLASPANKAVAERIQAMKRQPQFRNQGAAGVDVQSAAKSAAFTTQDVNVSDIVHEPGNMFQGWPDSLIQAFQTVQGLLCPKVYNANYGFDVNKCWDFAYKHYWSSQIFHSLYQAADVIATLMSGAV